METERASAKLPQVRVLFDATYAHRQDGTGRYTREILRCLKQDPDLKVLVMRARRVEHLPCSIRAPMNGLLHLWYSQVWLPLTALFTQAHIVHTMTMAPWFAPCPVVVTIHDALDFQPRYLPSRLWSTYVRTVGAIGARRADAIVTVSEPAATEIARHFRVSPGRIHVIWNASRLHQLEPLRPGGVMPDRYVLFVGNDTVRKNLSTALAAIELLRQRLPEIELLVAGSVNDDHSDRPWVTALGGVSDRELVWLYENAVALIVPSRHEGFGLPLFEALTFGTPVVASDIPALRHIGGNAARYVALDDAAGFARELEAIARDPQAARQISADDPSDGSEHTWERAAAQLVDVYLTTITTGLRAAH